MNLLQMPEVLHAEVEQLLAVCFERKSVGLKEGPFCNGGGLKGIVGLADGGGVGTGGVWKKGLFLAPEQKEGAEVD